MQRLKVDTADLPTILSTWVKKGTKWTKKGFRELKNYVKKGSKPVPQTPRFQETQEGWQAHI